jgi:hippurate hydrolase
MLPEVIVLEERTPPGFNDPELASRLGEAWTEAFGVESIVNEPAAGMGGEDFAFYTIPPPVPSVFWRVGGTTADDFERARAGGPPIPSRHSPSSGSPPSP